MLSSRPTTVMETAERWLLRAIIGALVLLALLLVFAAWHTRRHPSAVTPTTSSTTASAQAPASSSLTIIVDYGDGSQKRIRGLAFTPGMTVLDAMRLARENPHPIVFEFRGEGETALVTRIDDVINESGPGGTGTRAWQYWINAQYGQVSVGAAALHAGDRVSWAFKKYEPDPGRPPE